MIQILAGVGVIQSLQTLSGEVLLALDRAGWLLRFTMLWFAASVGAFAVGLHWGILGVAACYAVATVLVEPVRTVVTSRALGISPWRFVRSLAGVARATAIMAAALLPAREALLGAGLGAGSRLALLVALGSAVYVAGCLWRAPEVTLEVRRGLRRRARARTADGAFEERPAPLRSLV